MNKLEFVDYMRKMNFYFKLGGPDITKAEEMAAWYDALMDIDRDVFVKACVTIRDTFTRHPTIADFKKLCGCQPMTDEQQALKAADTILDAALNGGQARHLLGELAFAVSQRNNGFHDIGQQPLHEGPTYSIIRKKLERQALDVIRENRDQGIEIAKLPPVYQELRIAEAMKPPQKTGLSPYFKTFMDNRRQGKEY